MDQLGTEWADKISNKSMLKQLKMLLANQINEQIKFTEMWKSINQLNYPLYV